MDHNDKLHILRQNRGSKWSQRIISECTYLQKLFAGKGIEPTADFLKAVDYLYDCYVNNGAIIKENTLQAEQMMQSLTPMAKENTMHMVAHAHIDMDWCWDWSETVTTVIDTFRTMLDLLREYPDFIFSQSQASTYAIIEEYAPYMLPEIRQRIQEGRWEVTASTWVEADQNMPDGESLSHHILYTKKYMNRLFGLKSDDITINFEPDTDGHNENLPEFLSKGGVKYLYYCRGFVTGHFLFRWKSPSGASVIAFEDPRWYSAILEPDIIDYCADVCITSKTNIALKLYGIGDHGGGPSRRDIERIMEYNTWPLTPNLVFGTLKSYFERVEHDYGNSLPVIDHELNFIFHGCYTSQSRIKMANRIGQQRLYDAEMLTSFARMLGHEAYPQEGLEKGWHRVLQNQFHDILPGSGLIDTREHALSRFQEAAAYSNVASKNALIALSDEINTSDIATDDDPIGNSAGAGAGEQAFRYGPSCMERGQGRVRIYHLFNTSPYDASGVHKIPVWSWPHEQWLAQITDEAGNPLPVQVVKGDESWFYQHFAINVDITVPAFGYRTVVLDQRSTGNIPIDNHNTWQKMNFPYSNVLENDKIKAVFDDITLELISLTDKATGKELIKEPTAHILYNLEQCHDMAAWELGEYIQSVCANKSFPVSVLERSQGCISQWIKYGFTANRSKFEVTVTLNHNSNALEFFVAFDMMDYGTDKTNLPRYDFAFKPAQSFDTIKTDIAGGIISRKTFRDDIPANSFAAAGNFMMITDNKHGYNGYNSTLSTCLARATYYPDVFPENFHHETRLALIPVNTDDDAQLLREKALFINPILPVSGKRHSGKLAKTGKFIEAEGKAVVSGIKCAEDGRGILVHLYAVQNGGEVRIKSLYNKACMVDLNEADTSALKVNDKCTALQINKGEIAHIRLFD